jgi:uncharacterized protein
MSVFLLAPILAWLMAQAVKYTLHLFKTRKFGGVSFLYQSGSMPSSHTATVVALMTAVGVREGLDSALFGVVAVLGLIVAYDAMQVRRAAGEQGLALKSVLAKLKLRETPHHALGHRPQEVAVGALIGLAAAGIVLSF